MAYIFFLNIVYGQVSFIFAAVSAHAVYINVYI